jgi:hypothetical protein
VVSTSLTFVAFMAFSPLATGNTLYIVRAVVAFEWNAQFLPTARPAPPATVLSNARPTRHRARHDR